MLRCGPTRLFVSLSAGLACHRWRRQPWLAEYRGPFLTVTRTISQNSGRLPACRFFPHWRRPNRSRADPGTATCGTAEGSRRRLALHPGPVGKFCRQGSHHGYANDPTNRYCVVDRSVDRGKRTALRGVLVAAENLSKDHDWRSGGAKRCNGHGRKKGVLRARHLEERDSWLRLPYTGIDGVPKTGQAWVRGGALAATVIVPPTAGKAVTIMTQSLQTGVKPPERAFTTPESFPSLAELTAGSVAKPIPSAAL